MPAAARFFPTPTPSSGRRMRLWATVDAESKVMKTLGTAFFSLTLQVVLLAVIPPVQVLAQEDPATDVGESYLNVAPRELQAQADAEPPHTSDRSQLAAFYHRRGYANHR